MVARERNPGTHNFALRLQKSLLDEVRRIAAEENTTMNQFINVAVAEKTSALRTQAFFRERAGRADFAEFDRILQKAGSEPPRPGDEIPVVAPASEGATSKSARPCRYSHGSDFSPTRPDPYPVGRRPARPVPNRHDRLNSANLRDLPPGRTMRRSALGSLELGEKRIEQLAFVRRSN